MHWTQAAGCRLMNPKTCELSAECAGKEWGLDVKHVRAHRTEKEKTARLKCRNLVMEGNERRRKLANEGADVNGG